MKDSKIIAKTYLGEHVKEIAEDICKWLMENINQKISPSIFKRRWSYFWWESEYPRTKTIPGITLVNNKELYWRDELNPDDPDHLPKFYKMAYKEQATKFILFNNNCYIDIVAIKGKPLPEAIAIFVLGAENALPFTEQDSIEYLPNYSI